MQEEGAEEAEFQNDCWMSDESYHADSAPQPKAKRASKTFTVIHACDYELTRESQAWRRWEPQAADVWTPNLNFD